LASNSLSLAGSGRVLLSLSNWGEGKRGFTNRAKTPRLARTAVKATCDNLSGVRVGAATQTTILLSSTLTAELFAVADPECHPSRAQSALKSHVNGGITSCCLRCGSSHSVQDFRSSGRLRQGHGRPGGQRSRNAIAQNRSLAHKSVALVPRADAYQFGNNLKLFYDFNCYFSEYPQFYPHGQSVRRFDSQAHRKCGDRVSLHSAKTCALCLYVLFFPRSGVTDASCTSAEDEAPDHVCHSAAVREKADI
jgi:hypothetical protein